MQPAKTLFLALALVALAAGTAPGEIYVEAYLGGVFPGSTTRQFNVPHIINGVYTGAGESAHVRADLDPAFQGGLKLGAWFDRSGVLSRTRFPAWAKYLGFYVDISYHRLNFPQRRFDSSWSLFPPAVSPPEAGPTGLVNTGFLSNGYALTLAFMCAVRYGFFPDQEVPFGRLQPYVAAGPAILFSYQSPKLGLVRMQPNNPGALDKIYTLDGTASGVNLALALEAGLRWMALKNVSLEVSCKYRYANPAYSYACFDGYSGIPRGSGFTFKPYYNLVSFQAGAAYHF